MRERTLIGLAGVAVAALAAAVLLPSPSATTSATSPAGGILLPGVRGHVDTLSILTITGAGGSVHLARTPVAGKPAEGWTLRDKGGYPIPVATMRPVVDGLLALHGVAAKTQRPALYGRLDLGEPGKAGAGHLIAFGDTAGGSLGQIVLGRQKEAAGIGAASGMYARVPGAAATWFAEPSVMLPSDTIDWVDHGIVDINADQVKEVVLTQPGGPKLDFARDKPTDALSIRGLPADTKLKSQTPGSDVEGAFRGLELQDVKPAAQAGGSQAGSVQLTSFDGVVANFAMTKDNGQTWITVTASGGKAGQDIAARTKGWAYEIPPDKATTLSQKLADLVQAPAVTK